MSETILIIGAGHAAGQAVASLRMGGFSGDVVLVGDEPYAPYQRPPLSKQFLAGELELEQVYFKKPAFYDNAGVELRLGRRAEKIDRADRRVVLDDGRDLAYDRLILATGSRVRRLTIPGAELAGIHYLRTIDDVNAIRADFARSRHVAVVGGGYIGLEVAAVARQSGLEVTVLEMAPQLMSRVVAPEVAEFYASAHRGHGVDIRTGVMVEGFAPDSAGSTRVESVLCAGGTKVDADLAVIGVGIVPNVELATDCGLECAPREEGGGIRVDENGRTSDLHIFAAGDCTHHPNDLLGRSLRLESVHNAVEQAKAVAAFLVDKPRPYHQIPWFWSDQYDIKLQIAGLSTGHDHVVLRGDPSTGSFAACYLKDGVLIAVDAINSTRDFMASKSLIAARSEIPPERLADTSVPLKDLA